MPNSADNKDIKCHANGEDVSEKLSEQLGQHVSERVKLFEAHHQAHHPKPQPHKINNNIRHVVPVGLIIVLFTLYLALQSKYISRGQEDNRHDDAKRQELAALEVAKRITILEKLLEYKDLCTELEVFTKDIEREHPPDVSVDMISGGEKNDELEKTDSNTETVVKNNNADKENYKNNHSNINIKPNSNNKKGQPMPKKTNTAEPIIYLFALVFIYLLLKAFSDINQHYKSKNNGDKRLRRCSLQSYAQTHKQDRRASKGLHRIFTRTY
ncbi:uncharacterized protein LOC118744359 [Rhagoletis pomonella]|uniref:uncharacterized protein LOC118744359 n=1 Tax=Rhagoletis pomonella TaxID=28610 RepID=UPI00177F0387|nr:uncharacterized protein LOC118744359 [Rhagoletis pomonella]XP_036333205.1 uncharacterized protein LOC118744359 [Rhagoletis pomonella]XP_036333206.1 uncharacterized protein LOC118744359 [Rhagoletis pomonella]